MCLIAFAWNAHPRFRLVVAANRDEFHDRPTAAADWWADSGGRILAGRDLKEGGSWMGVSRTGRFAALTNRRSPTEIRSGAPSRGRLVADFLSHHDDTAAYAAQTHAQAGQFSGFNLLLGDAEQLWAVNNAGDAPRRLPSGVYALSNATLDSQWPKMLHVKQGLADLLTTEHWGAESLFTLLAHRQIAADAALPDTGVGLALERLLSSPFIVSPTYGTRCSTVITLTRDGRGELTERRFDAAGATVTTVAHTFAWPASETA